MEKIKQFIQELAKAEFEANKNLGHNVKTEINEKPKNYLHSILSFMNFDAGFPDLGSNLPEEILQLAFDYKYKARPLFQIRKYQNPLCGEKSKSSLKSDIVYCCYMSGDDGDEDEPGSLARNFYVAETDEGLKIIYYSFFIYDHWAPMNDCEQTRFTSPGEFLQSCDFERLKDEISIKALSIETIA